MENNRNWAGIAALMLAGLALLVALVGRGGPSFDFSAHVWNGASGGSPNSAVAPAQAFPVPAMPGAQLPADAAQAQADAQAKIAQAQADAQAKIAQAQADAQAKIAQAQGK